MRNIKAVFLVFILLVSSVVFAKADKFNTYQWNRKNELRGNSKVSNKPWFEWWYYKVVLPETNESFYFVYGVVNPWDKEQKNKATRSYVGMGDFNAKVTAEEVFKADEFKASYISTDIQVGKNQATDKHFNGDIIDEHGERFVWNVSIEKKWAFNATGWATGKNITNIEWYPAQADARCSGMVESKGKLYQFVDAPCYQDRNWGSLFPKWWAWIVSNEFENHPNTTLAIGGGKPIVWGRYTPVEGLAIGLKHKGKEYKFRPNYFDKVKVEVNFGKWEAVATNGKNKVEISAYAPEDKFMDLQFMTPQGEVFHDYETLSGEVTVKLYEKKPFGLKTKWKLIDTIYSKHTGIEYGSHDIATSKKLFSTDKNLIYKN